MTTLGQRWQTVVPLADGWVHNVRPSLGQHHRRWKLEIGSFYFVGFKTYGQRWDNIENCADHKSWLNNIGSTLGPCCTNTKITLLIKKSFISLVEKHRANVGTTSRFANKRDFDWLFYEHWTNVGSTLIFTYMHKCIFVQIQQTQWLTAVQQIILTLRRQTSWFYL